MQIKEIKCQEVKSKNSFFTNRTELIVPKEKGTFVKVDGIIIKPLQSKATDVRVIVKTLTEEIDVFLFIYLFSWLVDYFDKYLKNIKTQHYFTFTVWYVSSSFNLCSSLLHRNVPKREKCRF